MDTTGAEALKTRFAQQEQWREARAVRVGLQPPFDPDGHALEYFRAGVRFYREERRMEIVDGREAMVARRLSKRLVDGAWEDELELEVIQRVA